MRYSTTAIILAAMSIGEAVAVPSHVHKHLHEKRSLDDKWEDLPWSKMNVDWAAAYEAGHASKTAPTTSAPLAAVVDANAAATPNAAASSATSSGHEVKTGNATLWHDLVGMANGIKKFGDRTTSTGSEIGQTGNVGKPEGSNMMMVSSASGYHFTANFINTSGKSMTVVIWNKAHRDDEGKIDANLGSCVAPKKPTLTFAIANGENQVVAFDEGSLVAWAEACDEITPAGAFATTWGEAKFETAGSGYDMSAIQNKYGNNYNMSISSKEVECVSDPTQNYWLTDTKPMGTSDGSCYVPFKTATLKVLMGGRM